MKRIAAPESELIVNRDGEPGNERTRLAGELVALLDRIGVPAAVLLPGRESSDIAEFLRKYAEQILEAAQRCKHPEVRAHFEDLAHAYLAQPDATKRH